MRSLLDMVASVRDSDLVDRGGGDQESSHLTSSTSDSESRWGYGSACGEHCERRAGDYLGTRL